MRDRSAHEGGLGHPAPKPLGRRAPPLPLHPLDNSYAAAPPKARPRPIRELCIDSRSETADAHCAVTKMAATSTNAGSARVRLPESPVTQ